MSADYYPLKVIKKVQETKKCYSFYFSIPKEYKSLFLYQTAQFLTFRFEIKGKLYVRSYSISSSPFVDEALQTSVALVDAGVVSNHMISQLKEGDTVYSQTPLGEFFRPPKTLNSQNYLLFAAGIGITPLFSILKTLLETQLSENVTLIFSIRTKKDYIYKEKLEDWQKKHNNQLKVKLIISQEDGRVDEKKLTQILSSFDSTKSLFYLCGPKSYMDMITKNLLDFGIKSQDIYIEDFKVIPIRGPKPDENSIFFKADTFDEGEPETLTSLLDGEIVNIPLNREKSLLEQLIDQGYNPPFSCTSGSCMTCMAKLKEGKIFQLEEGILDEDNIKNLEILSCQCYPLSKKVYIDYDNL